MNMDTLSQAREEMVGTETGSGHMPTQNQNTPLLVLVLCPLVPTTTTTATPRQVVVPMVEPMYFPMPKTNTENNELFGAMPRQNR